MQRRKPTQYNRPPKKISTDIEALLFAIELGNSPSIDLHGLDAHSAIRELDLFLNRKFAHGSEGVHIIHGLGSGTLRAAVHRFLASHPLVLAYRNAEHRNQQGGMTVAAFRK